MKYRLAEAMKTCMRTMPVEKITVKEIVQECGTTRQTFYRYFLDKYDLINWYFDKILLESFEHMDEYVQTESVDVVCFNFGYLPGGNHSISTKTKTSLEAIEKGLTLLKHGGIMSLCIYSGGDTGFEEKDAILRYIKELNPKEYTVIVNEYYNRENNPPIPVFIFKR